MTLYPNDPLDSANQRVVGLENGKFTDGDPVKGIAPSIIPAQWQNLLTDLLETAILQENGSVNNTDIHQLANVLTNIHKLIQTNKTNIATNKSNITQETANLLTTLNTKISQANQNLTNEMANAATKRSTLQTDLTNLLNRAKADLTSLINQASSRVPVGTILQYYGRTAPSGFLLCDGTSYYRSSYSELSHLISSGSSSEFKVPDLRDRFVQTKTHDIGVHEDGKVPYNHSTFGEMFTRGTVTGTGNFSVVRNTHTFDLNNLGHGQEYAFNTLYFSIGSGNKVLPDNIVLNAIIKY